MQYNLLMLYKVLANFATNFVGAFVPLIVFESTGNMTLGILCIVGTSFLELVFSLLLKKWLEKKPQLFLLLRIVPLLLFEFCLIMVAKAPITSIVFLILFQGLQYSFKMIPSEIVLVMATNNEKNTKKFGFSRFFDQLGYVVAGIVGGFLLQYIDHTVVIVSSMILYVLSCLPLFIYYLKYKNQKYFNVENITNAHSEIINSNNYKTGKKIENKIKFTYWFQYLFIYALNSFYVVFNLVLYTKTSNFIYSGIALSLYDALYGIGVVIVSKMEEKYDLTILVSLATIVIAILYPVAICFAGSVASYILFEITALLWPLPVIVINNRMNIKTKVLGIASEAQSMAVYTLSGVTGAGFALCALIGFIPFAIVSGVLGGIGAIMFPINEEKTRKSLVNYLERC